MTDLLIYFADTIKGKSYYPIVRTFFNLIFLTSITNYVLSKTHPSLAFPKTLALNEITKFFIDGRFFIPLVIFVLVYLFTSFIGGLLFMWLGDLKNQKINKRIAKFQIKKNDLVESVNTIEEVSEKILILDLTKDKLMGLYKSLKPAFKKRDYEIMKEKLEESKQILGLNFDLTLRAFFAVIIYFITLEAFGCLLFILSLFTLLVCMALLLIAYKIVDLLPRIMERAIEAETIYRSENNL